LFTPVIIGAVLQSADQNVEGLSVLAGVKQLISMIQVVIRIPSRAALKQTHARQLGLSIVVARIALHDLLPRRDRAVEVT
ncbi:hypothetical protein QP246_11140, partial [Aerococcus urinae]|nr:hypothetical protein [Aerococcus urinae]